VRTDTDGPSSGAPVAHPAGVKVRSSVDREVTERPETGDPAVDEALRALDRLSPTVREHVAVFDAVHGALADRLAETRE